MRKIVLAIVVIFVTTVVGWLVFKANHNRQWNSIVSQVELNGKFSDFKNGDIIFQTSRSAQSKAIQLATKSEYSHCGIIVSDRGNLYVLEAVQPVKLTPLENWISRGQNGRFVVKRIKHSDQVFTSEVKERMNTVGQRFLGKNYDLAFEWSDQRIYCSELIWKIYQQGAGVTLSPLEKLGDFDLSHPAVKQKLKERYGRRIPLNEEVVSPQAIFESRLLFTVQAN